MSCDIPWERDSLGHFFDFTWTPGRKTDSERKTTNYLPKQIIWSSEKFEKRNRRWITMAIWALTHWLKPASSWQAKTLNWWTICRTACFGTQWLIFISAFRISIFVKQHFFGKLIFSSHCKQHEWWSYVKTCWVRLCLKMTNSPMSKCQIAPDNT